MDETEETEDLLSPVSDTRLLQLLLADLHDDLHERLARFRYLTDQSGALGRAGTMIYGGTPAYAAFSEARSSFVNGNDVAAIMLCQSLAEHTLAAMLSDTTLLSNDVADRLPAKIRFRETIDRCKARGLLKDQDVADLYRLSEMRNPLMHYRDVNDPEHVDRRAMSERTNPKEILKRDAYFAVAVMVKLLSGAEFRLDR